MDFENQNNCKDNCFKKALEKIRHDSQNRVICYMGATGPTGPAGGPTGPTERLFKSSNKIIINSS